MVRLYQQVWVQPPTAHSRGLLKPLGAAEAMQGNSKPGRKEGVLVLFALVLIAELCVYPAIAGVNSWPLLCLLALVNFIVRSVNHHAVILPWQAQTLP